MLWSRRDAGDSTTSGSTLPVSNSAESSLQQMRGAGPRQAARTHLRSVSLAFQFPLLLAGGGFPCDPHDIAASKRIWRAVDDAAEVVQGSLCYCDISGTLF